MMGYLLNIRLVYEYLATSMSISLHSPPESSWCYLSIYCIQFPSIFELRITRHAVNNPLSHVTIPFIM
jgi:hypothetical protein